MAGPQLAKALDQTSDVVLIEPKEAFLHNIAACGPGRSVLAPAGSSLPMTDCWSQRRVRDRAVVVDPHRVVTASGEEIAADFVVLASGSRYPFPAKTDLVDSGKAFEQVRTAHRALSESGSGPLFGDGLGRH